MNPQQKVNIAQLAEQYGRQVFQSAYRILSDIHLAEDVTQDVFLKLFKKPTDSFNLIKHWPGYLKTMAISSAIDQLRRNKRLAEEPIEFKPEQSIKSNNQPLQQMLGERDLHKFRKALLTLTKQDAELFCLRNIEGYSYQELALLMNMKSNAVGVALHRAQKKLLNQLGKSQMLGDIDEI